MTHSFTTGSKFKTRQRRSDRWFNYDMFVSEFGATKVVNGVYVDVPGVCCNKRSTMVKCSYSEADQVEAEEYRNAPMVEEGDVVNFNGKPHKVVFTGYGFDFVNFEPVNGEA